MHSKNRSYRKRRAAGEWVLLLFVLVIWIHAGLTMTSSTKICRFLADAVMPCSQSLQH